MRHLHIGIVIGLLLASGANAQQPSTVSNMPFASTPFNGSELLYIIQSGQSKKTNVSTFAGQAVLPNVPANTILGNPTSSAAAVGPVTVPSCSGASSALSWTSGVGFGCNTISGATLTAFAPTDNTGNLSCIPTAIAGSMIGNTYFGGVFTASACFANSIIFSGLTAVPNLYICTLTDMTSPANTVRQSGYTTTSVTFMATTAAGDLVSYSCTGA